jgi:DnaJ-domain-containing protein 1
MAPRFPRRSRPEDHDEPDEPVRLDDDAHAWWAQRPVEELWRPREEPPAADEPDRDVLAEHFGPEWRTDFGFDPPPTGDPSDADRPPETEELADDADAYAVLGVEATASWAEIVAAHRAMARRHHPDRVASEGPAAVAAAEERIVRVNAAYAELRVRRGR